MKKDTTKKDTPSHYEIFLKVVETGNISKASEALNYTQSGISHVISALEKRMGFNLFVRSNNGVVLTENGSRIAPVIQQIVNQEQLLRQQVFDINHEVGGKLRIGSFTSMTTLYLPAVISYFKEQYPDVELEILDGNYSDIYHWIKHGQIDCGFVAGKTPKGFLFRELIRDPLLVVMPEGHPLSFKEAVTLDEVSEYPVILQPDGYNEDMSSILAKAKKPAHIPYNLRDDVSILSFIEHGLGIGILPKLVLECTKTTLLSRPLIPEEERTIGLAMLPTQNSILLKILEEYLAKIDYSIHQ